MHSKTSLGHDTTGGKATASTNPLFRIFCNKGELVEFHGLSRNSCKSIDDIKVSTNSGREQTNPDLWSILGNVGLILGLQMENAQ